MKFGKRFHLSSGTRNVALFDIGSGSVGVALVQIQSDESALILHSVRTPIAFQHEYKAERLHPEMIRSLKETLKGLESYRAKQGNEMRHLSEVHIILASPWYSSRTHLIKVHRDKAFTVTERFLDDVMHKAKEQFSASGDATAMFGGQQVRLEELIIQTILNGYPTNAPYGKQASKLDAAVYLSLVDDGVRRSLVDAIEGLVGNGKTFMHSFSLLAYFAAREVHPMLNDYVLVDVSGEVTDLALVRDGVFLESASFPWGRNYLLRELAAKLGTIPEEAHTLLRLTGQKDAPPGDARVEEARKSVAQTWQKAFDETCAELAETELLPRSVLLTTLPDLAPWFASLLASDIGSRHTYTHEPFSVTVFGGTDIVKQLQLAEGVQHDPFLALEVITLKNGKNFL
jgi:cell division ATPase FtsA